MKRLLYKLSVIIALAIPCQLFADSSDTTKQNIILVANTNIASLSTRELKSIYATKLKKWSNGQAIHVFNLDAKNKHFRQFCLQNLHLQPYQLERIWKRMVFTGTGTPPITVSSLEEMKNKIMSTPGAIGYLPNDIEIPPQYKLKVTK